MTNKLLIALGTAAAVSFSHAAIANQAAPAAGAQQQPAMQAAPATEEVSDQQMQEFVKVEQEVRDVSVTYQEKLSGATDEAEISSIAQEANAEMTGIVEKSPLSVEEYNKIASLISADENLQQKYYQHRN